MTWPRTAPTPRREIRRKRKARLYRYEGPSTFATPILFVPNLGISRPYIFDLIPGASFVEYMTGRGFPFYLLDWGVFGPEDDGLTIDDCAAEILPVMWRTTLETSGAPALSLLTYSMGAALAATTAAAYPELPIAGFIDMAGAIDFAKAGPLARWLDRKYFDPARFVDVLHPVPPAAFWLAGAMLRPTMGLEFVRAAAANAGDRRRGAELLGAATWVRDFIGMPAAFFEQWVREFYQANKLYAGQLALSSRPVRLGTIACPVLTVSATDDPIEPPPSVRALLEAVGSADRSNLEVPGGHLALMLATEASRVTWPRIAEWLALRDGRRSQAA